jgi:allantoinase
MSLPDSYLEYPNRRLGNDHDWFDFSPLPKRPAVQWPGGEKVALFVTVAFEHYPLYALPGPVMAPTAVPGPVPNYIQYTLCDYGNRVGVCRLFEALDAHGFKATALFNSEAARLYPRLVEEVLSRGWEIAASGTDMSRIVTGQTPIEEERALIRQSLSTLRDIAGGPVLGWHSPAYSQSGNTFTLLADEGVEYVMDWINDDMPYAIRAGGRTMHALPINDQWQDANIIGAQRQLTEEIYLQAIAAYKVLRAEAETYGGRVLSLPLNPQVSGQPFRIWTVEKLLAEIAAAGCWNATGSEILSAFRDQTLPA